MSQPVEFSHRLIGSAIGQKRATAIVRENGISLAISLDGHGWALQNREIELAAELLMRLSSAVPRASTPILANLELIEINPMGCVIG
jgi:hypothetical protein